MDAHFLEQSREVPTSITAGNVVAWSIFRSLEEARTFLQHVHLAPGQKIVGGHGADSVAQYWWVGVEVQDLSQWGHKGAINKRGRFGD